MRRNMKYIVFFSFLALFAADDSNQVAEEIEKVTEKSLEEIMTPADLPYFCKERDSRPV